MRRLLMTCGIVFTLMAGPPVQVVHADSNDLIGGIGDIVGGVFALPLGVLQGTMTGPPIIGTLGGILSGTFQALGMTTRGVFKVVGSAVPIVTTFAPFLPLFL